MQQIAQTVVRLRIIAVVLAILGSLVIPARPAHSAQPDPFSVLHYFAPTPEGIAATSLMLGSDGNFYGTGTLGGAYGAGTVFKVTPAGVLTVLHSFNGADGSWVAAKLVQGPDGSLYGTTKFSSVTNQGTVFRVKPDGAFTTLHAFTGADGAMPNSGVILASDGNLYGVTKRGGAKDLGGIFRLTLDGVLTNLHWFSGGFNGSISWASAIGAGLIQGTDGNLYGVTNADGGRPADYGSIFRITLGGNFTNVYSFTLLDGGAPHSTLTQGTDGALYGTSPDTIFRVTPAGSFTVLAHSPDTIFHDYRPVGGLIQAADGNFYGAAEGGSGVIYKMTPGGTVTILHQFSPQEASPLAVIQSLDGNLYGVSNSYYYSTDRNKSAVFRMTTSGDLTIIHQFVVGADGGEPSSVMQAMDGSLYGTTLYGGANGLGAVFRVNPDGSETVLHNFAMNSGIYPDALAQGVDGRFYGCTSQGGPHDGGSIFGMTADGTVTNLQPFSGLEGEGPGGFWNSLVLGADGNLYGTTLTDGDFGVGTIFRLTPDGVRTVLHSFTGGSDDQRPQGRLSLGADGNIYGTTIPFSPRVASTIFRVTPGGVFTTLHIFSAADGVHPFGTYSLGVVEAPDGYCYGAISYGGYFGHGKLFRLSTDGTMATIHSFAGGLDGGTPGAMTLGMDGNIYGVTVRDDNSGASTVFRLTPAGGYRTVYHFDPRTINSGWSAILVQGADGGLYGTQGLGASYYTGNLEGGSVYRFSPSAIRTLSDFDHDGMSDLILQDSVRNGVKLWSMAGSTVTNKAAISRTPPNGFTVAGAGFFDDDAQPDLVLQNPFTRQIAIWYMNNHTVTGEAYVRRQLPFGWTVAAVGDFNNDGVSDLVLQNPATNQAAIWFMDNAKVIGVSNLSFAIPDGWAIAGAGDFSGTGATDLVLQNARLHKIALWHMTGATVTGGDYVSSPLPAGSTVVSVADTNGDGLAELVLQQAKTNQLSIWTIRGSTVVYRADIDHQLPDGSNVSGPQ